MPGCDARRQSVTPKKPKEKFIKKKKLTGVWAPSGGRPVDCKVAAGRGDVLVNPDGIRGLKEHSNQRGMRTCRHKARGCWYLREGGENREPDVEETIGVARARCDRWIIPANHAAVGPTAPPPFNYSAEWIRLLLPALTLQRCGGGVGVGGALSTDGEVETGGRGCGRPWRKLVDAELHLGFRACSNLHVGSVFF